jgi:uncharacterized membrane protein YjfL (UPF0719 family)
MLRSGDRSRPSPAIVNRAGYASPIRTPRGRDILAACGQLRSESLKVRASAVAVAASTSLADVAIWGVAALFVQLALFRLIDLLLHGLPQRVDEGELSAALLLVSAKLASAIVLSAAIAT